MKKLSLGFDGLLWISMQTLGSTKSEETWKITAQHNSIKMFADIARKFNFYWRWFTSSDSSTAIIRFIHSFIHSFVPSFVRSFIHLDRDSFLGVSRILCFHLLWSSFYVLFACAGLFHQLALSTCLIGSQPICLPASLAVCLHLSLFLCVCQPLSLSLSISVSLSP